MPRHSDDRSPRVRAQAAAEEKIARLLAQWKFHTNPSSPLIADAAKQIRREVIAAYRRFLRISQ